MAAPAQSLYGEGARAASSPSARAAISSSEVGTLIGVRLRSDLLKALDEAIAREPEPKPGRAEMIRRILRAHPDEP
ncbi:hypothetical protein [Salinarimonas sp.]|uniref:hypothetical protein n=1 Tax=Salinarimonas sp. TaxID=2766526 RepID=UPI0032D99FAB